MYTSIRPISALRLFQHHFNSSSLREEEREEKETKTGTLTLLSYKGSPSAGPLKGQMDPPAPSCTDTKATSET